MSDYKRFTHNPNNIEIASPCYLCKHKEERPIRNKQKCSMEECDYLKCYEKLAELEDKIENGTLIELPCKVGDIVWSVDCDYNDDGILVYFVHDTPFILEHYSSWGKYFFLTKAEAEKKLEELKGEV